MAYLEQLQQVNASLQSMIEKADLLPDKDISPLIKILKRTDTELTAKDFDGATKIGDYAFNRWGGLKSVELSDSIKEIGKGAFPSQIESIDLAKVEKIGERAFQYSQLKTLYIPNTANSFGSYCFADTQRLIDVFFEKRSTCLSLGSYMFYNTPQLKKIRLPEKLLTLSYSSLEKTGLETIVLPPTVETLDSYCFLNSTHLHTITMKPIRPPSLRSDSLQGCTALTKIIVPIGSKTAYDSATNWSAYADIIVEEDI